MTLKTKCIKEPIESDDGLRICIMRKYNPEKHEDYEPVDLHWPELSPSEELLKAFHKKMPWEDYVSQFTKEVLAPQTKKIKNLAKMALEKNVTILCYEDTPEHCHRSLVAKTCKMYEPNLELILN